MKKIFDRAHMNALYHEMLAHGETPEKYVMKKTGVDVETARKSLHAMREGLSDFDQLMKKPDLYLPYVQQFKQNLLNFKEDNDALRYLLCMVRPLMKAESNKPEFDALRHLDAVLAANGKFYGVTRYGGESGGSGERLPGDCFGSRGESHE